MRKYHQLQLIKINFQFHRIIESRQYVKVKERQHRFTKALFNLFCLVYPAELRQGNGLACLDTTSLLC
jgi:hypothetical protein